MTKKYCILDNNNKFIEICDDHEYASHSHQHIIVHTEPPNVSGDLVAYWKDDKWKIVRKKKDDKIIEDNHNNYLNELRKKMEISDIPNKIQDKYKEIPPFENSITVSNKLILGRLNEEHELLKHKLIYLFENKKRITKKLKIYKKDLEKKIKELENTREFYSELPVNEKLDDIDLSAVVPSRVPF